MLMYEVSMRKKIPIMPRKPKFEVLSPIIFLLVKKPYPKMDTSING